MRVADGRKSGEEEVKPVSEKGRGLEEKRPGGRGGGWLGFKVGVARIPLGVALRCVAIIVFPKLD